MTFNWQCYLDLANELLNPQKHKPESLKEAYLRTVVSRAYYGVFCTARDILADRGIKIQNVDSHNFVISQYQSSSDTTEQSIGANLSRLKKSRVEADYHSVLDNPNAFNDKNVAFSCMEAYQVMGDLVRIKPKKP